MVRTLEKPMGHSKEALRTPRAAASFSQVKPEWTESSSRGGIHGGSSLTYPSGFLGLGS